MFFKEDKFTINTPVSWITNICRINSAGMQNSAAREALILYLIGSLVASVKGAKNVTAQELHYAYASNLADNTSFT